MGCPLVFVGMNSFMVFMPLMYTFIYLSPTWRMPMYLKLLSASRIALSHFFHVWISACGDGSIYLESQGCSASSISPHRQRAHQWRLVQISSGVHWICLMNPKECPPGFANRASKLSSLVGSLCGKVRTLSLPLPNRGTSMCTMIFHCTCRLVKYLQGTSEVDQSPLRVMLPSART